RRCRAKGTADSERISVTGTPSSRATDGRLDGSPVASPESPFRTRTWTGRRTSPPGRASTARQRRLEPPAYVVDGSGRDQARRPLRRVGGGSRRLVRLARRPPLEDAPGSSNSPPRASGTRRSHTSDQLAGAGRRVTELRQRPTVGLTASRCSTTGPYMSGRRSR